MTQPLNSFALAVVVLLGGLAAGCGRLRSLQPFSPAESGTDNPQVVAADGVLCDLTRTLAAPSITVHCILSGGEDPHTFSLSPEQRDRLEQADLVLINGLNLTPALATLAEQDKALAVAEAIELQPLETDVLSMDNNHDDHDDDGHGTVDDHGHGGHHGLSHDEGHHDDHEDHEDDGHRDDHDLSHRDSPDSHQDHHHAHDHGGVDPHVWHDPGNTQAMAMVITQELTQLAPEEATALQALNQGAIAVLKDLDAWTEQQVEAIPPQQRVLATRHKAFGYYARRYGFRELAILDSFSTTEALRPAALSKLRRELVEAKVVALFPEQDPPGQSLQVISQQSGIPLSPQHLIADGLAPGQSTVATFVANTCAIGNGLSGQCDEAAGEDLARRWRALADHGHSTADGEGDPFPSAP